MNNSLKVKFFGISLLFVLLLYMSSLASQSNGSVELEAASETEAFRDDADAMGFEIGANWRYYYSSNSDDANGMGFHHGKVQGCEYEIHDVLLRHVNANGYFAYFYRVTMTPNESSYFLNGWCETIVEMRLSYQKIMNFAPQNTSSSTSGNISIGADSSGLNIGFSIDFNHSDLTVSSATNVANGHYETKYSYNNGISPYAWCSDFLKYTVYNYGALIFKTSGDPTNASIRIRHEIGFKQAVTFGFGPGTSYDSLTSYNYGR